ncbi:hypothetical protein EI012_27930, partial [Escherichia coli]|nr:hypothetical protein [Escherichia coli]
LENLEVKLEDEDKALILLSALPSSYEHFKDAILFGREQQSISLEEVQTSIRTKESHKKQGIKIDNNAESLSIIRGRTEKRGSHGDKHRSKSK